MDAVEYLKALGRLCNNYLCGDNCPLIDSCDDESDDGYVRKVQIVEQWAKEHPVKTRQSEFLKQWPDAEIGGDGYPSVAPCQLYKDIEEKDENGICCKNCGCDKCRRDFWLKEIECK